VQGERPIAYLTPAPEPVELSEYEGPIIRVLARSGGHASHVRSSTWSARRWPPATAPLTSNHF
jgi:hypothetical protein